MIQETRVLLANIDEPGLHTIDVYERLGGYRSMRKALLELTPEAVLHELEESGLRGRGGAGFSMGKKASFIPKGTMDKFLCCNADESEPGTFISVSTLLISVGPWYRPWLAGNGGLRRGLPRLPSSASRSAVSSPQI